MTPPQSSPVVHLELHTADLPQARDLYAELCGWRPEWIETRAGSYLSLELGDGLGGGIVECPVRRPASGCPTSRSPRSPRPPTGPAGSGRPSSWSPARARPGGEASSPPPVGGEIAFWQPKARRPSVRGTRERGAAARGRPRGRRGCLRPAVEPHRRALHAHCYRMLGSVTDAEDALQEALLRAWRGLAKFEGRSSLRSWLYTIATNACLRAIERRPKRVLPIDYAPGGRPPRRPRRAAGRIGLGGALSRRDARPRGRARRSGGALRAARERRARLHRGASAPAGAPARRAHPPRRARLLGARGGRGARDDAGRRSTARCSAPTRRSTSGFPSAASRRCSARSTTRACARSSTATSTPSSAPTSTPSSRCWPPTGR